MAKKQAIFVKCDEGNEYEHTMRDFCSSCAPFWNEIPTCPIDCSTLKTSGYCRYCKKFYLIPEKSEDRTFISTMKLREKYEAFKNA